MKEFSEFLAQAFIAFGLMPRNEGVFEHLFLNRLRELGPEMHDGGAEHVDELRFAIGAACHDRPPLQPALRRDGAFSRRTPLNFVPSFFTSMKRPLFRL